MFARLLIANRGEISIRIAAAAADLGIETVAVYSTDDAQSLHVSRADQAVALAGRGVAAYLDIDAIVDAARLSGADAIHPGYGFLSENADFARRCAEAGIRFVGPTPEMLALFGDKVSARALAARCGVPLAGGSSAADTPQSARAFFEALPAGEAMIIKAVGGGGGRGMRIVAHASELDEAFVRCSAEAKAAFGNDAVYVERLIRRARHIEVQIVGDGGDVVHIFERECTIQRRHQKLIEVAPSPSIGTGLRDRITEAAVTMARAAGYVSLGTFEFLVEKAGTTDEDFVFIEANPRLQVEHTVTEEVTGIDLVKTQIRIAAGATLADLGLTQEAIPSPRGYAIQLRINMETMDETGTTMPSGGTIQRYEPPSGPGVRVDGFGYAGYRPSPSFDSLLTKLIVHSSEADYAAAVRKAARALQQFRIDGIKTNIGFQAALLADEQFLANRIHTRFVEDNLPSLVAAAARHGDDEACDEEQAAIVEPDRSKLVAQPGTAAVAAPMLGTIVEYSVEEGATVAAGQTIAIIEALKMQHLMSAPVSGVVVALGGKVGDTADPGEIIALIEESDVAGTANTVVEEIDLDAIRPDLAEVYARRHITLDEGRPRAVAKRHGIGQRTTRENINDLLDPGSFIEYGSFVLAPQRARRTYAELLDMSPADGLVMGLGAINGDRFADDKSRAAVISYDWTVFAGTQGIMGHKKKDRMLKLIHELQTPLVLFAEGGGGRPGDSEFIGPAGLELMTFWYFARLSGLVPLVGITSRYCFAGNVALLGMCDVIIATKNSNIGMGGPAMIEGGGLGVFAPSAIGPSDVQSKNGVIDILVEDEAEAVAAAKKYLSYFQGSIEDWDCSDQRLLRRAIPENRLRVYEVRDVIALLADTGSVLELRREFGVGVVTAFIRIEGRPIGLVANNPKHLGGAVDADAADKSARFMQLCDAFDIPILMLCDTPGFMVGPEAEKTAQVRHVSRLFVNAANLTVPVFTIVLRKGYGLGALGSAGGGFHAPAFMVSWPTGEFGGMGLEGHVKLAFAKELGAIEDPVARQAEYERLVKEMYDKGKAVVMAEYFEIDEVIDPAESRKWIMRGLKSTKPALPRAGKKRPNIDTW